LFADKNPKHNWLAKMILHQSLQFFILFYWSILVKFFNDYLLELALAHAHSHLLVKLARLLDFAPLESLAAAYHHTTGPGTVITHPASRLVRLMLVKYLYDLSLRQAEERLYSDMLIRWFVGYTLFEPLPDHSTIERFEQWLNRQEHFAIFDEIVRQIQRAFPAETRATQIGDTYALRANAAQEELRPMLRHVCAKILLAAIEAFPLQIDHALAGFAWEQLLGSPRETSLPSKEEQAERLQRVVLAALELQRRVAALLNGSPAKDFPALRQMLGALSKILADEVVVNGQVVQRLSPKEQGSFRIGSATDVEASYRKHGPDPEETSFGYNIQVAVSKGGFIHETQASTGAVPDQSGVAALVTAQVERRGECPPKLIYDRAAGAGKTRAEVEKVSHGQTLLVAKLPDYEKSNERFGPYDFVLSEAGKTLTCPNQQASQIAYPSESGEGRNFRFLHFQCWPGESQKDPAERCPLWERCRQPEQGSRSMRQVFISHYRPQVLAAQQYNATEVFRDEMKIRSRVERVIFELTNYNGARDCRRRGVNNADWQARMCATAYNLKHWVRKSDLRARQMAARG
jgi:transposase